jgi:hypothetical protein
MSSKHHEILIDVDPDGIITLTVQGIQGKGCQGLAQALAEAMGGRVVDHGRTRDYSRTPRIDIRQKTGRR